MKRERLYGCPFPLIGLTGGISTGKTTASNHLLSKGQIIICADQLIKEIYAKDDSLNFLRTLVPEAVQGKEIDFKVLRKKAFDQPELLRKLESFLYSQLEEQFNKSLPKKADVVFYDVPLLFEKGLQDKFDETWLIYTSEDIQRERLALRDQLSVPEIDKILSQQLSIDKKRELAEYVVDNSTSLEEFKRSLDHLLNQLQQRLAQS